MSDETFTALQYAGPASWRHLIAPISIELLKAYTY